VIPIRRLSIGHNLSNEAYLLVIARQNVIYRSARRGSDPWTVGNRLERCVATLSGVSVPVVGRPFGPATPPTAPEHTGLAVGAGVT